MKSLNVLIACEYSGRVRDAFIDGSVISGFNNYIISKSGDVFSCSGRGKKKKRGYYTKMVTRRDNKGYLSVILCDGPLIRKTIRVHRLVAEHFIENSDLYPCVMHLDGNPENNKKDNLAWGSYKQNEHDKKNHGTWGKSRIGRAKLSADQVEDIRTLAKEGEKQKTIALRYNVSRPTITRIINNTIWCGI